MGSGGLVRRIAAGSLRLFDSSRKTVSHRVSVTEDSFIKFPILFQILFPMHLSLWTACK